MEILQKDDLKVIGLFTPEEIKEFQMSLFKICDHPLTDPDMMWIRSLEQNASPNQYPCILLVTRRDHIVGAIVAFIKKLTIQIKLGYFTIWKPRATVLSVLDHGIIGDEVPEIALSMALALQKVLTEKHVDYVHIASLNKNSTLRKCLKELYSKRVFEGPLEKRWLLDLPRTFDDFLKGLSPNIRHDLKWRIKKLEKNFPHYNIKIITPTVDDKELDFYDVLKIFNKTYQKKLGLSPLNSTLFRDTWETLRKNKKLLCVILFINGEGVAFGLCHIFKETCYFAATGYDPEYRKWYVGEYVWVTIIKESINLGLKYLDYGIGHSEKKRQLASKCLYQGHVRLFASTGKGMYLRFIIVLSIKINQIIRYFLKETKMKEIVKRKLRLSNLKLVSKLGSLQRFV